MRKKTRQDLRVLNGYGGAAEITRHILELLTANREKKWAECTRRNKQWRAETDGEKKAGAELAMQYAYGEWSGLQSAIVSIQGIRRRRGVR